MIYLASDIGRTRQHAYHVVIDVVHGNRHPDIVRLHEGIAEEDPQADTGNDLKKNTDHRSVRAVIKDVERQMPQSPEHSQNQNAAL